MFKEYVLGFLFNEEGTYVCLIKKNRPDFQAGLLNGLGGKVEPGELPQDAMRREFLEESGVDFDRWEKFAVYTGYDYVITCFRGLSDKVWSVRSVTDEVVSIHNVFDIPKTPGLMSNLHWLIPMALHEQEMRLIYPLSDNA